MQRFYPERETSGPEFDNKLIQLVRENPAIYDVSHPHYRRNPVRVAIWDRIATQLGAPSRFLQTKWKNIRYNYLQEIKCMETGVTNPNIRKRRFTADLSFLQHTAQSYNVKKAQMYRDSMGKSEASDNDSNGYIYPDPDFTRSDLLEMGNNEDEVCPKYANQNGDYNPEDDFSELDADETIPSYNCETELREVEDEELDLSSEEPTKSTEDSLKDEKESIEIKTTKNENSSPSPKQETKSISPTSPMLRPVIFMTNGTAEHKVQNGEITIKRIFRQNPLHPSFSNANHNDQQESSSVRNNHEEKNHNACDQQSKKRIAAASEIMTNLAKRKAMPAPFPCLTPINDPIELYCLSLVDSLRNMPRSERERVKFEFASILKDAKYKDQS